MYPLIPLGPTLNIPTYYLVISLTICICLYWSTRRAFAYDLSKKLTLDLGLLIMVTGFIGGRLFHVLYEDIAYYRESMWRIFEFWNGGFVFYGGALLAGLCGYLFLRKKDSHRLPTYLDMLAPLLCFSYAAGRLACLLAGCCFGKYCELPWAISGRHPTQAYAALWELGVLFILLGIEKGVRESGQPKIFKKSGSLFYLWMILHSLGRFIVESLRDDFRGPEFGISVSSWISAVIFIYGWYLLLAKPRQN
ncbi:prolipoprotein diacylglyceryl transferase [Bdellovibrio reynosensis]|uniref:Phosphatidylglycerol--prolipoprotein diacylglyceryl transferase n=1 Tax=Bdellovibrio reynosensis TaxID=2835041 RepID=A0ABY4C7M5_9BACT|nr:prolipoprotein diacylglyceryl transferase [Bdellovibrio reynosensis]UOF00888.1 prolipoprotein diacylglyceryl transferase [Bdellovibrio reynosensis]